jgi:formylmethanofuran dehydrogenase subunit D
MRGKESARGPHPQIIFIPYGPWVNVVVNPRTHGTGMPTLKGFTAEVKAATEEKVLSLPELLKELYGKG